MPLTDMWDLVVMVLSVVCFIGALLFAGISGYYIDKNKGE